MGSKVPVGRILGDGGKEGERNEEGKRVGCLGEEGCMKEGCGCRGLDERIMQVGDGWIFELGWFARRDAWVSSGWGFSNTNLNGHRGWSQFLGLESRQSMGRTHTAEPGLAHVQAGIRLWRLALLTACQCTSCKLPEGELKGGVHGADGIADEAKQPSDQRGVRGRGGLDSSVVARGRVAGAVDADGDGEAASYCCEACLALATWE